MTYAEAVKRMRPAIFDAHNYRLGLCSKLATDNNDLDIEALAVLRRAEGVMGAVEGAPPEDVAKNLTAASNYCAKIAVEVNGYVNRCYQGRVTQ